MRESSKQENTSFLTKPSTCQSNGRAKSAGNTAVMYARVQIALCSISSDRVVVSLAGDVGLAILPEGGEGIGFRQVVGGKLQ